MTNSKEFLKRMGNRISTQRKKQNLSQEKLAEKAGLSAQVISSAERGTKALRPENLMKIAAALDVSADYLLTGFPIEKDLAPIYGHLSNLSPDQLAIIHSILEEILELCGLN